MCGFGKQSLNQLEASKFLHPVGCADKAAIWIESHLLLVGSAVLGMALPQVWIHPPSYRYASACLCLCVSISCTSIYMSSFVCLCLYACTKIYVSVEIWTCFPQVFSDFWLPLSILSVRLRFYLPICLYLPIYLCQTVCNSPYYIYLPNLLTPLGWHRWVGLQGLSEWL